MSAPFLLIAGEPAAGPFRRSISVAPGGAKGNRFSGDSGHLGGGSGPVAVLLGRSTAVHPPAVSERRLTTSYKQPMLPIWQGLHPPLSEDRLTGSPPSSPCANSPIGWKPPVSSGPCARAGRGPKSPKPSASPGRPCTRSTFVDWSTRESN